MSNIVNTHETWVLLTICGEEQEIPVKIRYLSHPGYRGTVERGSGLPLEPDEEPSVEILSICTELENGTMFWLDELLSPAQEAAIKTELGAS